MIKSALHTMNLRYFMHSNHKIPLAPNFRLEQQTRRPVTKLLQEWLPISADVEVDSRLMVQKFPQAIEFLSKMWTLRANILQPPRANKMTFKYNNAW